MLEAEFVAAAQVLVYAGAVSILMLFGIMLTRHRTEEENGGRKSHIAFAFVTVLFFFAVVFYGIQQVPWTSQAAEPAENNTYEIGRQLFTNFVIPFELVSVVLLVALVGAIILAKKEADDE